MNGRARRRLALVGVLCALVPGGPAGAFVPTSERILEAVAGAGRSAGRSGSLEIRVGLRVGEGPPAEGVIMTSGAGATRLEVRAPDGILERHLRSGARYRASRGRAPLPDPRHLAPPLFLLQADSGPALAAALAGLAVATGEVELGRVGARDCFVVGGREPGRGSEGAGAARPSIWVDVETLEVVRIDPGAGEEVRLGPSARFEGAVLPAWVEIRVPEREPVRLEVRSARRISPAPRELEEAWLTAPGPGEAAPQR